jgi:hypothetical protein
LGTGAGGTQGFFEKVTAGFENALKKGGGQVEHGVYDLSQKAIEFRRANGINSARNVAVFEYLEGQQLKTITRASERGVGHSERIINKEIEKLGIPKDSVTRIYSELEPCMAAGGYCKRMIGLEYPNAIVTHSFEYGITQGSRAAGVAALKESISKLGITK